MSEEIFSPATEPVAEKPAKKNLPLGVRALLAFASVLLCICLTVSVLVTALAVDLNLMFRDETLVQMVDSVLFVPQPSAPRLSEEAGDTESLISQLIYEALQKQDDEDALKFTKADVDAFVKDASISDYLTDKTVSYLQDFINGTNNTTITSQELETLIDENKALIEETFDVEVDEGLRSEILTYVEDNNVNNIVHDQIIQEVRETPIAGESFNVGKLMEVLSTLASPTVIMILAGIDLFLLVLLFFTNRMRLGGTMICAGVPTLLVGAILAVPVMAAQSIVPMLLGSAPREVVNIANLLLGIITPVHLAVLITGAVLLVVGIIVKCVAKPKT